MSEEKKFKVWRGEKNVSVEFRLFGKKMEIERRVPEKKSKCFLDENLKCKILLSSCSLVGLYVNLQVEVMEKKMMKIFRVFFGSVFEVKSCDCKENLKSGIFIYWVRTHSLVAML